jgi:hypothetical protein
MATHPKPDFTSPSFPGSGKPQVPQPGQFAPATPGQGPTRPSAQVTGPPVPPAASQGSARPVGYVDPLLFLEGFFSSQADYDQTVRLAAAKIRSGQIQPREPDLDDDEQL